MLLVSVVSHLKTQEFGVGPRTYPQGLYTDTIQAKWDKGGKYVANWLNTVSSCNGMLNHKEAEQGRGFLVHLSRIYSVMVPGLKGIYHVLDA